MSFPTQKCPTPIYRQRRLQIIFAASLIPLLGYSLINPAFPAIVENLGITPQEVGLLITFYGAPAVVFVPAIGILADRFGRKKVLVPSLLIYGLAGGACAFTHNFGALLALRFLQGLGGAAVFPMCMTLIGDYYSGAECTQAMGYNFSVTYVTSATYPFIGGAVALLAWNYPFLIYFAAVPVGLLVLFKLESPAPAGRQDIREYLTSIVRMMRRRQVLGVFLGSLFMFTIYSAAYLTYLSLLIGSSFGASSLVIGLMVSLGFVSTAVTAWQVNKLARRISVMNLIKLAFVIIALSLFLLQFASSLWMVAATTILFGVGLGIIDPGKMSALNSLTPAEYRAALMALDETFVVIGMSLGPLLFGAVFVVFGLSGVFNGAALLALAAFALLALLLRPVATGKSV